MSSQPRKQKIQNHVLALRRDNQQPFFHTLLALLDEKIEAVKDELLTAPPDRVAELQGRARAYKDVLSELTRPMPPIQE